VSRLDDLRRATEPGPDSLDRVRDALSDELDPATLKALLQELPERGPDAVARVQARLDDPPAAPPRLGRPGLRATLLGVIASVLALVAWVLVPSPTDSPLEAPPVAPASAPAPRLDRPLPGAASLPPAVVRAAGEGHLGGTPERPVVSWFSGELELDGTAARQLTVTTREATLISTDGGRLGVVRDPLGSHVRVLDGSVRATCHAEGPVDRVLIAGDTLTCLPVSIDGMLGRLRAQDPPTPQARLHAITHALSRPQGSDVARAELGALRIATLVELGRPDQALSTAEAWLDSGHTVRRTEVLRFAASLALSRHGCERALPHLTALAPHDDEARAALNTCRGDPR